jgi:hypothetical protein
MQRVAPARRIRAPPTPALRHDRTKAQQLSHHIHSSLSAPAAPISLPPHPTCHSPAIARNMSAHRPTPRPRPRPQPQSGHYGRLNTSVDGQERRGVALEASVKGQGMPVAGPRTGQPISLALHKSARRTAQLSPPSSDIAAPIVTPSAQRMPTPKWPSHSLRSSSRVLASLLPPPCSASPASSKTSPSQAPARGLTHTAKAASSPPIDRVFKRL